MAGPAEQGDREGAEVADDVRLSRNDWRTIVAGLHYAAEWEQSLADCCEGIEPDFSEAKQREKKYRSMRSRLLKELYLDKEYAKKDAQTP